MNFTLQLDSVPYTAKPKGREIGALKTRLSEQPPTAFTLEDFAEKVTQGYSFTPAVLMGGSKAENWQYQQVFGIDIDNEDKTVKGTHDKTRAAGPLTVERVLDRCNEWRIKPALIYETFSSTPEWQKFRVLFIGGTAITDKQRAANILKSLMEIFPECDQSCKNLDRLFFGGKSILHIDSTAVLTGEKITSLERMGAAALKPPARIPNIRDNQLKELIQDFDFLGYIRDYFPGTERRAGNLIQINPCPICGHNDDFRYYESTKTFYCFGVNGSVGGTIIDFVMHTRNVDYKEAIKYFKYVLCGLNENRDKADFHERKMIERHNLAAPIGEQVAELPPYIFEKVNKRTGEVTYCVLCPALAEHFRKNNHYFWIKSIGGTKPLRYLYRNGVYVAVQDEELVGILRDYITSYDPALLKMRDAYEAFKNICCDNVFHNADELNADENVINFQNGILHLDTMELTEHDPDLLSTIQIPCPWSEKTAPAPVLDSYIETLTEGDKARQRFIYSWCGLIMSNIKSRRFKQSLWLVGEPNSGKSKLIDLIASILGTGNCASIELKFLEENQFSTSSLFGKRLAYCGDMSADPISDLSKFKDMLGGKMIKFEFKGHTPFTAEFNGFFMFAMNNIPPLGRDSIDRKAIYNRITIMPCNNVIPENKQDKELESKLYAERIEFIRRCVLSAVEVIRNGYRIHIPEASRTALEQYKSDNSNVGCFIKECCEARIPNMQACSSAQVYDVYNEWCRMSGYKPLNLTNFRKELSVQLSLPVDEMIGAIHGVRYFKGIQLTVSARQQYMQAYLKRAPTPRR